MRILVVDDEPTIRTLLVEVMLAQGYRVLEAADAATALALLSPDTPLDLLITDVGLPGALNGRQLADALRGLRPELPVLFITVLTVGLGLIVNSMAGFALSRLRWKGRLVVMALIIATLIVPFETIAVPMVYWVSQLPTLVVEGGVLKYDFGWLNTYQVQIVPSISQGRIIRTFVVPNPNIEGFRAAIDVQLEPGRSADLRAFLRAGNRALTETWTYPFAPG